MAYVRVTRQCLSLDTYRQHRQWIFKHQQQQAYVTSLGHFAAQCTVSLTHPTRGAHLSVTEMKKNEKS